MYQTLNETYELNTGLKPEGIKLNAISWHVIVSIIVVAINYGCYKLQLFTYAYIVWRGHYNYEFEKVVLMNVGIFLVFVAMWDIINWGYWKGKGIILVSGYTLYFMIMCDSFTESRINAINIFSLVLSIVVFATWGKPGNIADRIISKYIDTFESDRFPTDYETQMMSIRNYYNDSDMEPYEVLYEQVGIMLKHEILDDDVVDILSAKESKPTYDSEYSLGAVSLDNPRYNPLHSNNMGQNAIEPSSEMMDYINNGLRTDYIQDYHSAKNGDKDVIYREKPFSIVDVEREMRSSIEELNQVEMLLTYTMIALYKNVGTYKKFSVCAARTYITLYIQSGIIKYGDFFVALIALLNAGGITEITDFEDEEIFAEEY